MKTSKYRGVHLTTSHGYPYWMAQLQHEGTVYRKSCVSEESAVKKYNEMCIKHGLFEKLNEI